VPRGRSVETGRHEQRSSYSLPHHESVLEGQVLHEGVAPKRLASLWVQPCERCPKDTHVVVNRVSGLTSDRSHPSGRRADV